jgi:hypothetical protein
VLIEVLILPTSKYQDVTDIWAKPNFLQFIATQPSANMTLHRTTKNKKNIAYNKFGGQSKSFGMRVISQNEPTYTVAARSSSYLRRLAPTK